MNSDAALDTNAIAATLRARLAELDDRMAKVRRDAAQGHSSDWAEQAQERENDEVLDAICNETLAAIAATRRALQRIADGTYGSCAVCGEPIGATRLASLPETTVCIHCRARQEGAG